MRAILKLSIIALLMCLVHQHLLVVAEWSVTLQRDWTDFQSNASILRHFRKPARSIVADDVSAPKNDAIVAAITTPSLSAHHFHWR